MSPGVAAGECVEITSEGGWIDGSVWKLCTSPGSLDAIFAGGE